MVWAYGAIFVVIGLASSWAALLNLRKAQAALGWPVIQGKILASSVCEVGGDLTGYKPDILYEYHAHGIRHSAKVWRVGASSKSSKWKAKAEAIIAEYPAGRDITVFFNPQNPADAVLEPGKVRWVSQFVIGLILAAVGLFSCWVGISVYLKDQQARHWPATTGQILYSSVDESSNSDGDTTYTPLIQYSYRVNDQQHVGSVWRFGASKTGRTEAYETIASYRIGSTATVFFNPDHPEEAVLEPNTTQGTLVAIILSLPVALLAGFYVLRKYRSA
jgi:hypothetical protein